MAIRTITGTIEYAGGAIPAYSRAEFYLTGIHIDDVVISTGAVVAPMSVSGEITVDLYPNSEGYGNTRYHVDMASYEDANFAREVGRVRLGQIYVQDIDGQTLQDLLAVYSGPAEDIGPAQQAAIDAIAAAASAETAADETRAAGAFVRMTLPLLLSDTVFSYTDVVGKTLVVPNETRITVPGVGAFMVSLAAATNHNHVTAGGVKVKFDSVMATPFALGETDGGAVGVDGNTITGAWGAWPSAIATRPAYTVIPDPGITVGAYDLELTGHFIDPAVNSAHILGGRASYYSQIGPDASLSWTIGADNINNHLAGVNLGFHCDLIKHLGADGITLKGSHGIVAGGSFKQVSGDYSGSFAGQMHQVFALQSVACGGRNIIIGSSANADAVRRSGSLGGYLNSATAGYQVSLIGGESNVISGGDNSAIIGGNDNTITAGLRSAIVGSNLSTVSADNSVVMASTYAVGDVPLTVVRANGRHTASGDNQTYGMVLRRRSVGPNVFLSRTGGSGIDVFTPPARTRGVGRFQITVQEDNVSVNNGAEFVLEFAWSNLNGTLTILGQTLRTIYEDNAAFNATATTAGTGTRLAIQVVVPNTNSYVAHASGELSVQKIGA